MSARDRLFMMATGAKFSPKSAAEQLDAYRNEVLREAADKIREHDRMCADHDPKDGIWGCDYLTCRQLADLIDPDAAS